jgi:mannan endo-1,4-beta-mannosidase
MKVAFAFLIVCFLGIMSGVKAQQGFVQRKGHQFFIDGQPYYYVGANYWYGSVLGLEKDRWRGSERLRRELDFLKSKGISNLRIMAAAEGSGLVNGVERVGPPLQTAKGKFNTEVLKGLDLLLSEMAKRNMKAILFFSNNWEWSGGFLQYLNWNGLMADSVFKRKLAWDEMRDYVSKFYTCDACKKDYLKQVDVVLSRTNSITGKKYTEDKVIMSWELANEPRPMRPASNEAYKKWISEVAAFIKSKDKNHLVTTGHEGEIGTESMELFEAVHADKNIDYLTIHIWPRNWSWYKPSEFTDEALAKVNAKTKDYITRHEQVALKLNKPLVIEEFGLPRDNTSFDIQSTTSKRDQYYATVFDLWLQSAKVNGPIAGANFWAFNGTARPIPGQVFWKKGDDYMGDPPMEEQGLYGVFDSDASTWNTIYRYTSAMPANSISSLPSDKKATPRTVALYKNLKKLLDKGVMFGHQDDLAYGVDWKYVAGKSDVKEVVGDYPAVYGWELGNIEHHLPYDLDSVPFDKMKNFIREGFERGGIITISWHCDNPYTGGSAWDTTAAVSSVLPGGDRHALYKQWLDNAASFLDQLKDRNGIHIPVLFRPYHELTGNWFWWCRNKCTPAEFKLLWRFTVDYLKNEKNLHHLLYVYNTSGDFNSKEEFLERYPGDDVVDMVSFDIYQFGDPATDNRFLSALDQKLGMIEEIAKEKGKIAALGETGYEKIPYAQWWTNTLWKAIGDHKISYVLVWRNHGLTHNGNWHYYVPKKHDVSSDDFRKFYHLDKTLFEKDVAKYRLYQ